jgi:hypothetical protein
MKKWMILLVAVGGFVALAPRSARADDCLEVGWRDQSGHWTYYRAWLDAFDEGSGRVHIRYDFHHGELELKVREREHAEGGEFFVLKGRWFEGRDAQRSGRVFMKLEKGHHRAKGWYTYGENEDGARFDFALRDCKR